MRILIADDDRASRFCVEAAVIEWGHETVAVSNGDEALEILCGDTPPQLAILDWMMPGPSGVDVCKAIKGNASLPYIYIILLTSRGERRDLVTALDQGADDFLVKPVALTELRSRLAVGVRTVTYEQRLSMQHAPNDVGGKSAPGESSENHLIRSAFETSELRAFVVDESERIIMGTRKAREFVGLSLEEVQGLPLRHVVSELPNLEDCTWEGFIRDRNSKLVEQRLSRKKLQGATDRQFGYVISW